ncbi:hypothetical protein ACFQ1R_00670 [Mariniflexile jejuense]|uniref:Uncharacterized protein n=1 Tax=Mariniflexile jejuense TaxID=1173582 RepID=A0ABW3JE52_9FLAO
MKNKLTIPFYSLLLSLCITLISSGKLCAQENGIYEIENNNSLSKETAKKSKGNNREDFYNLAYKLHPTSYAENKSIKKVNNSAKVSKLTFNDSNSFNVINQTNSNFNDVELITIKLNSVADLNNKLDLTDANGFNNLKYVYIKCSFKCTETQIKQFINSDSNVRVFYKIEIPS